MIIQKDYNYKEIIKYLKKAQRGSSFREKRKNKLLLKILYKIAKCADNIITYQNIVKIRTKNCQRRQLVERVRRTKLSGKEESNLGRKSLRKKVD